MCNNQNETSKKNEEKVGLFLIEKVAAMKCINGPYRCSRIGFSGDRECCGYLLAVGETKFINSSGIINEPCPLPAATIQ